MKWNKVSEIKPVATETSVDWDGKRSDPILIATKWGGLLVGRMYKLEQDGRVSHFFCDLDDWDIEDPIVYWAEIPNPLDE